jgi:hypothetical protein
MPKTSVAPNTKPLYLHLESNLDKFKSGDRHYATLTISLATLEDYRNQPWPMGFSSHDEYDQPYMWQTLEIFCQMDDQDHGPIVPYTYGWEIRYKPYAVDRVEAKKMVKTLDMLYHGLKRLEEKLGYPNTFQEWVARIALILKVKGLFSRHSPQAKSMTGYDFKIDQAKYIRTQVGFVISQLNAQLNPEKG